MPTGRSTLRIGSRAAATREPRQVRKEAALSAARRVPRTGLVRADRFVGHADVSVDGGCTAITPLDRHAPVDATPIRRARRSRDPDHAGPLPPCPTRLRPPGALPALRRSQTFDEIVGQDAVVETLRNAVRLDRLGARLAVRRPARHGQDVDGAHPRQGGQLPDLRRRRAVRHAALPASPSAKAARSTSSSSTPPRTTRSTTCASSLPRVYTAPSDLQRKVFIIDEVQRIKEGWDVLLKTLEEPPRRRPLHLLHDRPERRSARPSSRASSASPSGRSAKQIEGKLRRILEAEDGRSADDRRLGAGGATAPPAACATPSRCSTRSSSAASIRSPPMPCATCWAWRTSERSTRFIDALVDRATARRHRGPRRARGRGPRPRRLRRPGRRRACASSSSSARSGGVDDGPSLPGRLADAARRLAGLDANRARPAAIGCSSSSSSSSPGRRPRSPLGSSPIAARPAPAPSDRRPRRPSRRPPPLQDRTRRSRPPGLPRLRGRPDPRASRCRTTLRHHLLPSRPRTSPSRPPTLRSPPPPTSPQLQQPARSRLATKPSGACAAAGAPSLRIVSQTRPTGRSSRRAGRSRSATASSSSAFPRTRRSCVTSPNASKRMLEEAIARGPRAPIAVRCVATNLELVTRRGRARHRGCLRDRAPHLRGRDRRRRRRRRRQLRRTAMGFGNLAKMAQQMQAEMARVQAELEDLTVEGSAGGGAVTAVVSGKQEMRLDHHRTRSRRSRRRRDAPGPRHRRRQRRPQRRPRRRPSRSMAA